MNLKSNSSHCAENDFKWLKRLSIYSLLSYTKNMQKFFHQSNFFAHQKTHFQTTIFFIIILKNDGKKLKREKVKSKEKNTQEIDGKKGGLNRWECMRERRDSIKCDNLFGKISCFNNTQITHRLRCIYSRIAPHIPAFMFGVHILLSV